MILTKATFKRMVDLFAVEASDPLWNDGEPWYIAPLVAPYSPGPDFEELDPSQYIGPATGGGMTMVLPSGFKVGYIPNTNVLQVRCDSSEIGGQTYVITDPLMVGYTFYGYYLYYSVDFGISWAATVPLANPIGPIAVGDLISYPPCLFTFDPAFQI